MSVRIMAAVWGIKGLSPVQKLVLLKLADCATDDGFVPDPDFIDVGVEQRAARRALSALQEAGYLAPERYGVRVVVGG